VAAKGRRVIARNPSARSIESFARDHTRADQEHIMLDILMLALAAGFFALAIGYTYACERL
jgi:hypothetical protein